MLNILQEPTGSACGKSALVFHQIIISPRRMPIVTASVRPDAPSLAITELTWNFTVCSEMPSLYAMVLFPRPSASIPKTSTSRSVKASTFEVETTDSVDSLVGVKFGSEEHNRRRRRFLSLGCEREQTLQLFLTAPFKFSNYDIGPKFIYLCGKSPGSVFISKREPG